MGSPGLREGLGGWLWQEQTRGVSGQPLPTTRAEVSLRPVVFSADNGQPRNSQEPPGALELGGPEFKSWFCHFQAVILDKSLHLSSAKRG